MSEIKTSEIVTPEIRIAHKVTFMMAHIVNSIILFIQSHSEQEFYDRTGFYANDLQEMVAYKYDFDLAEIAKLSTFLNIGITIVTDITQPKESKESDEK